MSEGHEPIIVGSFDFESARTHSPEGLLEVCVGTLEERHRASGYTALCELPPIPPTGASDVELTSLEQELGVALPSDYRLLLSRWRYLDLGAGLTIWGLDYEGVSIGRPWVSDEHPMGGRWLVVGDYWMHADGDQLMIELDSTDRAVMAYLHEYEGRTEYFAPSVSLALWRMLFE